MASRPRLQSYPDDGEAREVLMCVAVRDNDLGLLQQIADEDPARGRRAARRLIDGGHKTKWGLMRDADVAAGPPECEELPLLSYDIGVCAIDPSNRWHLMMLRPFRLLPTWDNRRARLFSCDCAEHVLRLLGPQDTPSHFPRDDRIGHLRRAERLIQNAREMPPDDQCDADARLPPFPIIATSDDTVVWALRAADRAGVQPVAPHSVAYCAMVATGPHWLSVGTTDLPTHSKHTRAEQRWQRARLIEYLLDEVKL